MDAKINLITKERRLELAKETQGYSTVFAKHLNNLLSTESVNIPPKLLPDGISTEKDVSVSIYFTGVVYGEYVLALSKETAFKLLGHEVGTADDTNTDLLFGEICETLTELLNMTVGEAIVGITKRYEKITITSPKFIVGKIRFPKVEAGCSVLETKFGPIECLLYIDRMELDLTTSYNETLQSLEIANSELRHAMAVLQNQQEIIAQKEKLSALGTMAAGVAHEINTPLATISLAEGSLKTLINDTQDAIDREKFDKLLKVIDRTVFRIAKITNALRDYAKSGSNVPFEKAQVKNLVNGALIFCESQLQEKGILFLTGNVSASVEINCRPQQISQVLFNLIANSTDALEVITADRWIRIETIENEKTIDINVIDAGGGIEAPLQNKIFDPFFTTKEIGQGCGLGLSVAKGIMDLHNGKIFVDPSSPNTKIVLQFLKN